MKTTTLDEATIIKNLIFSDKEANARIRIKKVMEKIEAQRIKRLSKKPMSIEKKIITTYINSN